MIFSLFRRKEPQSPAGTVEQALDEAATLAKAGNYEAALAIWGPLAHQGSARAANNVGACFMGGLGVEVAPELAVKWLSLAAEGGDPLGMRNFASALFQGKGAPQDYAQALHWYRGAAQAGDAEAQDMLSWMLLEGEIVEADPNEARQWAEKAAAGGMASSMTRMGMIHHNALAVPRDAKLAAEWWAKGVEAGDGDAMAMLGAANHLGQGVEHDPFRAMVLLIMAREKGSQLAAPYLAAVRATLPEAAVQGAEQMAADILGRQTSA